MGVAFVEGERPEVRLESEANEVMELVEE